jgi:hypothetical protein
MKKNVMGITAVVLIVAGGAFYGGIKYADGRAPTGYGSRIANLPEGAQMRFQQSERGAAVGAMRGGTLMTGGEIIGKDGQSITVKLQDGGSRIVFLSESTPIAKSALGSMADLSIGENVTVTGSTNQDGSITAQSVQIGTAPRMFRTGQ